MHRRYDFITPISPLFYFIQLCMNYKLCFQLFLEPCSLNMEFMTCGCSATCDAQFDCNYCSLGCFCKEGHRLDNWGVCVPQDMCSNNQNSKTCYYYSTNLFALYGMLISTELFWRNPAPSIYP